MSWIYTLTHLNGSQFWGLVLLIWIIGEAIEGIVRAARRHGE